MKLLLLKETFSVCKLSPNQQFTEHPTGSFYSASRTPEEISVVCQKGFEPAGSEVNSDWRALKVAGILDFSLTGILASIAKPLAEAETSIFAVSTFNTDYILVKEQQLNQALEALQKSNFQLEFIKSIS